ncbi:MAG: Phospholipid ABC transporter shuttle protein MlaC [Burkholderiaceae bacterium]|jgi:phospholipid transport system substrate-binding protein|nr:MAG: Phospholipid ABC transporter shuttle protein MlaC [Burkholderiaceae bacterium]
MMMNRRVLARLGMVLVAALAAGGALVARAADATAPDALIKQWATEVLTSIQSDKSIRSGDTAKVMALVDSKIMPNTDFERMTASAVGPAWRQATPQQKEKLQAEFKTLLVRTYAGALSQVSSDQTIYVKPLRADPGDADVVVRTEVRGSGDPIQIDYRMEKTPGQGAGWKIYNFNVMGVWLVDTYRSQFAEQINKNGIDGLISSLAALNKANAARS